MSDILRSVQRTAHGLHKAGVISRTTMREFDALCLTPINDFSPAKVRELRLKHNLSQPVFARYLNVSDKLVKKWEQGESKPRGAALKMLVLADQKGLDAIA
jgi:putative transcriptional regulator